MNWVNSLILFYGCYVLTVLWRYAELVVSQLVEQWWWKR